ncbi:MAG: hypothetical protein E7200_09015 [Selenomonas ruminantium]|nr:hypothetical protein [Selenomonas ruminantium]
MTVNITVIFSRSYCTSQQPKPHHQSADKVGGLPRLFFRQAKLFLAQLDALHQEGHIACQCPHGLQALSILRSLARRPHVDTVPILASDGLIKRYVYNQMPPKVEYSLTERSHSLVQVLDKLCDWGNENRPTK